MTGCGILLNILHTTAPFAEIPFGTNTNATAKPSGIL